MTVRFVDIFCGMGGFRLAAERAGGKCVFSCDKDTDAKETYEANWEPVDEGDIHNVDESTIPDHELLTAGWPCPSFSIMGDQEGLQDERGHLFYNIIEILDTKETDAFVLENVENLVKMNDGQLFNQLKSELEDLGYYVDWEVLCSFDFGLPQHRERLVIVGFKQEPDDFSIPTKNADALETPEERRQKLSSILVDEPPDRYTASEEIRQKRQQIVDEEPPEPSIWHENRSQDVSVNPHACALRANASWNYQLVNGERHPTPRELLRLQGYPDWIEIPTNSYSAVRKLTGRTIPVPMFEEVINEVIDEL